MNTMLWGNMIGITIMAFLAWLSFPAVVTTAGAIGTTKIAMPLIQIFGKAILCGYIMTLATKSDTPLWLSAVCVFAFVCTGLNHCIPDMFYYLLTPNDSFYIPLGVTVIGNIIGGRVGRV
jgi:formate/nitrite transporter FocA (FNT family)